MSDEIKFKHFERRDPLYKYGFRLVEMGEPVCGANLELLQEARRWCEEQFGPPQEKDRRGRWRIHPGIVAFYASKDAVAFKMRWG